MLLARYLVCVKTWIPHVVQCAVVGTSWKLARRGGTSNFLWFVSSFASWIRWLVPALLSLLSLKFSVEFKGKQIILGALQKDRCIVLSSLPDECLSIEIRCLSQSTVEQQIDWCEKGLNNRKIDYLSPTGECWKLLQVLPIKRKFWRLAPFTPGSSPSPSPINFLRSSASKLFKFFGSFSFECVYFYTFLVSSVIRKCSSKETYSYRLEKKSFVWHQNRHLNKGCTFLLTYVDSSKFRN